jgi:hypothetical protein
MPEPSHLQKSGSGYGWLLPVTVARPQRIFTAFCFLSQYLHILIFDDVYSVKGTARRRLRVSALYLLPCLCFTKVSVSFIVRL